MGTPYRVVEGDCLSSIAEDQHYFDWRTIYRDGENETLRRLRRDPNVLAPGDVVMLPDKGQRVEAAATGKRHTFRVNTQRATLRLMLEFMPTHYRLVVDGRTVGQGVPPESGLIEHRIARNATRGELLVWFSEDHDKDAAVRWQFRLGHLHPVETPDDDSGLVSRLRNLAFLADSETGEDAIRQAVARFQDFAHLPVTGVPDPATRARLRQLHDEL